VKTKISIWKEQLERYLESQIEDYEKLKEIREERPLFDEYSYGRYEGQINLINMILKGQFGVK